MRTFNSTRWALNLAIVIAAFTLPKAVADILDETDIPVGHYHASPLTASLTADVNMTSGSTYYPGAVVTPGSIGVWFVSANMAVLDTAGSGTAFCKLWDGTTIFNSGTLRLQGTNLPSSISLSGEIANPQGGVTIACEDNGSTTGVVKFNSSGNSKDTTTTAYRIR